MDPLDKRVSRILGQVRGIQKMVKEKRAGSDILQQIASVKKAIDGLTEEIVKSYIRQSLPIETRQEFEHLISQVIDL